MFIDFNGPFWDADLIGANGKLSRLHKGASKPPKPAPIQAPVRQETDAEGEAARQAGRRDGLARTILSGQGFENETLGGIGTLGGGNTPRRRNAYGGEE